MTNEEIKKRLNQLAEPAFQKFSSGLIPNLAPDKMLGVRLPKLRKIAREIAKGDWRTYLREACGDSFEEIMLQGMVIGYIKAAPGEILPLVKAFLPKIDNWSVCDSFCAGLKLAKLYPDALWTFLPPYLESEKEYETRFAIVMLIYYYMDAKHILLLLQLWDTVRCEAYYVKTALAWAVSICYTRFPEETMPYLLKNRLDDFTYYKTLQKITESRKMDGAQKNKIRAMQRKKL